MQLELGAFAFINVTAGAEELDEGSGSSTCNRAEAAAAVYLLRQIDVCKILLTVIILQIWRIMYFLVLHVSGATHIH